MKEGDRVRIQADDTSDGSRAQYVGREGTVVIVKSEVPSSVAVKIDGDEVPWLAFSLRVLERLS